MEDAAAITSSVPRPASHVVADRAIHDRQRSGFKIVNAASRHGRVVSNNTVRDREGPTVRDATSEKARIIGHGTILDRRGGLFIEDPATPRENAANTAANGEALYLGCVAGQNVKDDKRRGSGRSRDGEQLRSRTVDGDVLIDDELSGGQRDGLAIEGGVELDGVAIVRVREGLTERARFAISCGGDNERGRRG